MNRVLVFILSFLFCANLYSQPGKDGPMVVGAANTVVNCYSAVTNDVTAGTSQVTVNNSGGGNCNFVCGDLIMIHQAQGASMNTTNTAAYGTITAYNNSGLYEFNYVVSVTGNTVTVQNPWANTYTAAGRVQVIKVPQYTTLTVSAGASIVPIPWQDIGAFRYGGIVAIHVTGNCVVNGTISSSGFGFRPGPLENLTSPSGAGQVTVFVSTSANDGAAKGESIAGFTDFYDANGGRYGRGAPANGGGGGNGHNCGGGGGSNGNNGNAYNGNGVMCAACVGPAAWALDPFTIGNGGVNANSSGGGRGGYSYGASNQNALVLAPAQAAWGGDRRDPFGGLGGKPLTTIAPANRIFFGGGGGAGDRNNSANLLGGTGGGVVYIMANNISGAGQINASGTDALNQIALNTGGANDAPGGGGGGGTVILRSPAIGGVTINARGGKGGDQGFLATESEGPGGGGGGGYIAITAGAPAMNVNGGDNGVTLSGSLVEFTPNGATIGGAGELGTVPVIAFAFNPFGPIVTNSNSPVCEGATLSLTTTAIAGVTYAWTGPNAFTSAVQNPNINPALVAHTGQFQVIYTTAGGCTDTNWVNAVVNPAPVLNPVVADPLCSGLCTGIITANASLGQAPYGYLWSNAATTSVINNLCAGPYSVTVTDANGCTDVANATITSPAAIVVNAVTVPPACNGACTGSATINAVGGTGAFQYSLNGGAFQASNVFNALCAGAHTVTVRDANNCTQVLNFNITQPAVLTLAVTTNVTSTCGLNNGSVTVTAAGGTAPYQYNINGGPLQASNTFAGLAPGNYVVEVTGTGGCTATVNVTIASQPGPVAAVATQNNVTCFGGLNGSVMISAVGGTAPITYDLNPGPGPQASNSFINLAFGAYTVVVSDANGCTSNVNFNITQPTQLTYASAPVMATCNGTCNGEINIVPAGGTPPYEFSSNNGLTFQPTSPLTGLCAGNIFVVVRDANGCLANSVVVITQPVAVSATFVEVDPICNGSCDGQITVNASGGTGAYNYSVNGGPTQASNILTGLCAGNQNVVVTDANGCTFNSTPVLTNPPGFTINLVDTTSSNCGFNDGALEVLATGGNAPYQYSSNGSPNQPTGVFNNLVGGAYQIIVTDALGCQEMTFIGVNDLQMGATLLSITDATCFGSCDGILICTNNGGSAPITFELDNQGITQPSGTFNGLCAGPHIVTVYDAGFCVANIMFNINEPDQIAFSTTTVDIDCNGASTGEINFTGVTGGTGAYEYSVDNGATFQPSPNFTGLAAGTYDLIVRDANLCSGTGTATLNQNTLITYVANINDLTCFNNTSGFLQLVAAGGQGPYTHSTDSGLTFSANFTFINLPAGTYNVVIEDALGCQVTGTEIINEPTEVVAVYVATATTCNGACDGTVQVNANGGTPPYMYSADNGVVFQLPSLLSNLCIGAHTIVVSDDNGCLANSIQNITQPTAVNFVTVVTDATCGNNNGTITINAAGGTPAYDFSIDNGANFQPGNVFNTLAPGTYQIVVEDVNDCPVNGTATVINAASPIITAVVVTNATCNGNCDGSLVITASGGTGALLFDIGGAPQSDTTFNGLCAAALNVTVTDANGCTDIEPALITEPAVLNFAAAVTDLLCFNDFSGSITVNAAGGTLPYFYSFDNGATFSSVATANNLSAGAYNVVVEDANGCQFAAVVNVNEPPQLIITAQNSTDPSCALFCDGQATVTVNGGTVAGLYTYLWSGGVAGVNQNTALNLCAGAYTLDIEDDNGCTVNTTFTLVDPAPYVIDSIVVTDVLCTGDCNGTITIHSVGGTQFSIDGGITIQPGNVFNNLCPGVYNVQSLNANGCIANSIGIVGEPTPVQVICTPDSVYCGGTTLPLFAFAFGGNGPYTYAWSNAVNTQSQNVTPVGNQFFTVVATDANGCVSNMDTTEYIPIPPYVANIVSSATISCVGDSITLTANLVGGYPFYEYSWSTGDTTAGITIVNNVAATYSVIVNDQCNVIDTLTISIQTFITPQVNFTVDNATGCTPVTVTLTNTTPPGQIGANCVWTFSDGTIFNGCAGPISTFTIPGCYDVSLQVTSPDGCIGTATQNSLFCVFANPVANFTWNPEEPTYVNPDVSFTNLSTLGNTYLWDFSGFGNSTDENPEFSFTGLDTGFYQVCLDITSINGCVDDTCQFVHVGEEYSIYVPNTFTPDGDGVNEFFFPVLLDVIATDYEFLIFDRWGELIFTGLNTQRVWDGTHKGIPCKQDVYVWKIKLTTESGDRKSYYGHVSLLR